MNSENTNNTTERSTAPLPERRQLPEVDFGVFDANVSVELNQVVNTGVERKETQSEARAAVVDSFSRPLPNQTEIKNHLGQTEQQVPAGNFVTPETAKHLDRIEQEWVDAAKKVLASTSDDPFGREEQIKDLQADYLFKRYGRQPGDSNSVRVL